MPISHQYKAIFVHIPKTAGSSIEAVLGMHGGKPDVGLVPYPNQFLDYDRLYGEQLTHLSAAQIKAELRNDTLFDSYFKFTIVRNPWERLVSGIAWQDQKWAKGVLLTHAEVEKKIRDLHARVQASRGRLLQKIPERYEARPRPRSRLATIMSAAIGFPRGEDDDVPPRFMYPQFPFVVDRRQNSMIDFVGRYETLHEDWEKVCGRLGVTLELPVRMKSHHLDYRSYYNDETRAMVAQMYATDIRMFDYAF